MTVYEKAEALRELVSAAAKLGAMEETDSPTTNQREDIENQYDLIRQLTNRIIDKF